MYLQELEYLGIKLVKRRKLFSSSDSVPPGHSYPEENVGKKKGSGEFFFSKIIFLDTTDHENSFPKIRSDPAWA